MTFSLKYTESSSALVASSTSVEIILTRPLGVVERCHAQVLGTLVLQFIYLEQFEVGIRKRNNVIGANDSVSRSQTTAIIHPTRVGSLVIIVTIKYQRW